MTVPPGLTKNVAPPGYVLITGAGGGIGLGMVDYFLGRGARNLACHYRGRFDGLDDLFRKHGLEAKAYCFQAELTDEPAVKQLRLQVNERFGRIWGLVNLAGASTNRMIWKMSKEDFLQVISDNLLTTFLCTREFVPDLREREGGRIVNVSSIAAFTGVAGAAHYCAAKSGIIGLTRAAALELAPKKVTVNAIALGYFDQGIIDHVPPTMQEEIKGRTPLRRFGEVTEAAAAVEYLLSENAAFVTGQVLHLNGGLYG
jgi:NAD(P)-dependent dehydrogenase (short-subunit alcohol dehydrogenase family)